MNRLFSFLLCLTFLLVACIGATPTPPPLFAGEYEVSPYFRQYFEAKGGMRVLGGARSKEIVENGVTIQYFQNVRLEYHPEMAEDNGVMTSPIGLAFHSRDNCVKSVDVPEGAYYFDCHTVRKEVKQFFEQLGGLKFAGMPLTEMRPLNTDQLIQHYERVSLIWDTKKPAGQQIFLANLGAADCNERCPVAYRAREPYNFVQPTVSAPNATRLPTSIKLRTQVEVHRFVNQVQTQTLKAWVSDETNVPIPGVVVWMNLQLPGSTDTKRTTASDAAGYAWVTFEVRHVTSGDRIYYTATANYRNLIANDNKWFIVWWNP